MSKTKLILNVVHDMRALADSLIEIADAIVSGDDERAISCKNEAQAPMADQHSVQNNMYESQQGSITKSTQSASQAQKDNSHPMITGQVTQSPENDTPKLDLVTLRAAVAEYSNPENRPKIKEILTRFGVKKLTELKEEQFGPLFNEVCKACEK